MEHLLPAEETANTKPWGGKILGLSWVEQEASRNVQEARGQRSQRGDRRSDHAGVSGHCRPLAIAVDSGKAIGRFEQGNNMV